MFTNNCTYMEFFVSLNIEHSQKILKLELMIYTKYP